MLPISVTCIPYYILSWRPIRIGIKPSRKRSEFGFHSDKPEIQIAFGEYQSKPTPIDKILQLKSSGRSHQGPGAEIVPLAKLTKSRVFFQGMILIPVILASL